MIAEAWSFDVSYRNAVWWIIYPERWHDEFIRNEILPGFHMNGVFRFSRVSQLHMLKHTWVESTRYLSIDG